MRAILTAFTLAFAGLAVQAQTATVQPDPPRREWKAMWITHPTAGLRDPVVLHFRRALTLAAVPPSYIVRVSADNRFILYVNGHRVGDGPARGDLEHWRYERFDLAPLLKPGQNLITATVWNWGVLAPLAQVSDRTAFMLESEAGAPSDRSSSLGSEATGDTSITTPDGWQVEQEQGHSPLGRDTVTQKTYFASGPGEQIDASRYDWAWNDPSANGSAWVPAGLPMRDSIFPMADRAHSTGTAIDNFWNLVPDSLPPTEYTPISAGATVRVDAVSPATPEPQLNAFPGAPVTIPASTHVHILLDRKTLTTAYPLLTVSGGKGAHIRLTYSEALFDKKGRKGDRDEVADRVALGLNDSFLPDGGAHRFFQPLWWRTWRYLDLDIETAGDPLTLESLTANFSAYPFKELATFNSPDPELARIWEISWRTARDDAHETYMDTPYYEQLQYVGDTRIQSLISYTVAGDGRLARQALEAFDQSRTPDGYTRSRYPSSLPQTTPSFSLRWIGMEHDYWLYRRDPEQVRHALTGTRAVLAWFATHEQPDGLLNELPGLNFVDGGRGIISFGARGESCLTSLEYLGTLGEAADLEKALGDPAIAAAYLTRADHVRKGIFNNCWSESRGLIASNPDRDTFSEQGNILGVLYDAIPKDRQKDVLHRMLAIEPGATLNGITGTTYYFRFYLARAMDHAGMADEYLASIEPWRKMLALHFSTWPEYPGNTRSDSHAWSAHPMYDLLTLVAGIEPASPGFATVRIAPHMGTLPSLTATLPHPDGTIKVDYHRQGNGLNAIVTLPGTLTGTFVFNGKTWPLTPGVNRIQAP